MYAVNSDGTLKWSFTSTAGFRSGPAIDANGDIYVGSIDNNFYAFDPDGSVKWTFTTGDDVVSGPAIGADGTIYFGSADAKLYALEPVQDIDVSPASLQVSLPVSSTTVRSLTVANTGGADLDWWFSESTPWISATTSSSTVAGGASQEVQVTFDSAGLGLGVYNATITITSTDADEPQIDVPVTLHVVPSATAWSLAFLAALLSAGLVWVQRRRPVRR